jgi:hypothetical protein
LFCSNGAEIIRDRLSYRRRHAVIDIAVSVARSDQMTASPERRHLPSTATGSSRLLRSRHAKNARYEVQPAASSTGSCCVVRMFSVDVLAAVILLVHVGGVNCQCNQLVVSNAHYQTARICCSRRATVSRRGFNSRGRKTKSASRRPISSTQSFVLV